VYSHGDIIFLCNRKVAGALLENVLPDLVSRAGNEKRLFPLDYGRMLRVGEGNGLALQVFPDVGDPAFREALKTSASNSLMMAFRRNRGAFEAAHQQVAQGKTVPVISGHWRFRNDTKQYAHWLRTGRLPKDHEMCSMRHWYYHVHQTEPEVLMRVWPQREVKLSKTRHYEQCNCEPPECIPHGWQMPWPDRGKKREPE
ncbi:unnamed protein product, partial [Polarella glacialis]